MAQTRFNGVISGSSRRDKKALIVDAMGGGLCKIHGGYYGHGKHGLRDCPYCDIDEYYKELKTKGRGNFEQKDPSCIGRDGEPKAPEHREAMLRTQARGANNVPANKRNSGQIIKEMWNAFYAFDYAAFEAIQKSVDLKNPEIKAVVERIESHPSWGKSHTIHEKIIAQKEKQEREAWQREMEYDALHGLHHKHANTFFGKVIFDPEYREVCNRLGIIPQLTKVT